MTKKILIISCVIFFTIGLCFILFDAAKTHESLMNESSSRNKFNDQNKIKLSEDEEIMIKMGMVGSSGSTASEYWIPEEDFDSFLKKAKKGDAEAARKIASFYYNIKNDEEKGIYWFEVAAQGGNEDARQHLLLILSNRHKIEDGLYWARKFYNESTNSEYKRKMIKEIEHWEYLQKQQLFIKTALETSAALRQTIETEVNNGMKIENCGQKTLTQNSPFYPELKHFLTLGTPFLNVANDGVLTFYAEVLDVRLILTPQQLKSGKIQWSCEAQPEYFRPESCPLTDLRPAFLGEAIDASTGLRVEVERRLRQLVKAIKAGDKIRTERLDKEGTVPWPESVERIAVEDKAMADLIELEQTKLPIRKNGFPVLRDGNYAIRVNFNPRVNVNRCSPEVLRALGSINPKCDYFSGTVDISSMYFNSNVTLSFQPEQSEDGTYSWTCEAKPKDLTPDACAALGADAPNANHAAAR